MAQQTAMGFWLTTDDTAVFGHLTTATLAETLPVIQQPQAQAAFLAPGSMLAAGAMFAAQPAALAVLRATTQTSVDLLSLVVAEPFRRLGLARELLNWIEQQALQMGWQSLSMSYPLGHGSTRAMKSLTDPKLGWQWTEGLRLVHLDRDGAQMLIQRLAPLVQRLQRFGRFSLLSWGELGCDAQKQLGQRLQAPRWAWPIAEDPDTPFACLDAAISTVLLDRGRPIGWLIAHRVGVSLFRVTKWWVVPAQQGKGIGLLLLEHTIREALATEPEYNSGSFGVAAENGSMLRLCARVIEPLASNVQSSQRCHLEITSSDRRTTDELDTLSERSANNNT